MASEQKHYQNKNFYLINQVKEKESVTDLVLQFSYGGIPASHSIDTALSQTQL